MAVESEAPPIRSGWRGQVSFNRMPGLLAQLPTPKPGLCGWPWTEETPPPVSAPRGGWPRISIVCPSYNQADFIEETIRSVLLQNYPALELIVIDGASTDGTRAILERYSPWISHWVSEKDRGQSHAINKGFERASGDILGWVNSDDYYLPGALHLVALRHRAHPRGIYFGDWCERQGQEPSLTFRTEMPAFRFQVAVGGRHLPSHATFWPRSFHQPVDESLRFTMDADLFKRLASAGLRPCHIPQPLGVFRRHAAAKTSTMVDVAQAESAAWSRRQPWYVHWLWLASLRIDRLRLFFRAHVPRP